MKLRTTEESRAEAVETLLTAAAEYKPESEMPAGAETRALARLSGARRRGAVVWIGGTIAAVCLIGCAFFAGSRRPSIAPSGLLTERRSEARVRLRSAAPYSAPRLAKSSKGRRTSTAPVFTLVRGRSWRGKSRQVHRHGYASVSRRTLRIASAKHVLHTHAPAPQIWRTEIEERQTVGYIASQWSAGPPNDGGTATVITAPVAVPVLESTSIHAVSDGRNE